MNLNIVYSADSEQNRVGYTLRHLGLYREMNYSVFLPAGISASSSPEAMRRAIETELANPRVREFRQQITTAWERHKPEITAYLKSLPFEVPDTINLVITKYGVGGSYTLPNIVTVNVMYKLDPLKNLVHEITHLAVELPVVNKFSLNHSQKEGLVDWILMTNAFAHQLFPEYQYQRGLSTPPSDEIKRLFD